MIDIFVTLYMLLLDLIQGGLIILAKVITGLVIVFVIYMALVTCIVAMPSILIGG